MPPAQSIHLRINCIHPPRLSPDDPVEFGLQDKSQQLHPGTPQPDGSLRFECALQVRRSVDGTPNFLGDFAHGTPQDRFLYLTWKQRADNQIVQRIKIKMASITWAQIDAVAASDQLGRLEASIEATRTGSVPLLGEGWACFASTGTPLMGIKNPP